MPYLGQYRPQPPSGAPASTHSALGTAPRPSRDRAEASKPRRGRSPPEASRPHTTHDRSSSSPRDGTGRSCREGAFGAQRARQRVGEQQGTSMPRNAVHSTRRNRSAQRIPFWPVAGRRGAPVAQEGTGSRCFDSSRMLGWRLTNRA